jgi:hypothetical protein
MGRCRKDKIVAATIFRLIFNAAHKKAERWFTSMKGESDG